MLPDAISASAKTEKSHACQHRPKQPIGLVNDLIVPVLGVHFVRLQVGKNLGL